MKNKVVSIIPRAVSKIRYEIQDPKRGIQSGYYFRLFVEELNEDDDVIGCKLLKCTADFAEDMSAYIGEKIDQNIAFDENSRACALYG